MVMTVAGEEVEEYEMLEEQEDQDALRIRS